MRLRKRDAVALGKDSNIVSPEESQIPYVQDACATNGESSITPAILSPYYIIPRGSDMVNASKNLSSLLNVNDILVDSHADLTSSLGIPHVYEGDLMHDDLTEDDRRLAAALVAVQLVNQQKHQSGGQNIMPILQPNSLSTGPKTLAPSQSGLDSLSLDNGMKEVVVAENELLTSGLSYPPQNNEVHDSTFLHPLSPLKKALCRSRYFQNEPSASTITLDISDIDIANNVTIETPENINFLLSETEMESDYDQLEDSHRQTLPHKKRIAKRLRKQRKPRLMSSHSAQTYTCELCQDELPSQLKFFQHLKSHYENTDKQLNEANLKSESAKLNTEMVVRTLRTRSVKGQPEQSAAPMPRLNPIFKAPVIKTIEPTKPTPKTKTYFLNDNQNQITHYPCHECKISFRRQKMYDAHMVATHAQEEPVEEFSDPEDMMEGIRLRVDSDDDEPELKDNQDHHKPWVEDRIYPPHVMLTDVQIKNDAVFQQEVNHTEADLDTIDANIKTEPKPSSSQSSSPKSPSPKKAVQKRNECKTNDTKESIWCDICNICFETREDAGIHISEEHGEVVAAATRRRKKSARKKVQKSNYACKLCDRTFAHKNSLLYHERIHAGYRAFQCDDCGKAFYARNALKVHMRLHSDVKPFKCEFCSRDFRQSGDLKYHVISIHSNKKDYQCEYCGKSFARKYSLTVHNRIHTGERNYKCEFCDKSFRAATYLQNHRRIHTGERPYQCVRCNRSFRVRSDLVRHMTTHHHNTRKKQDESLEIKDAVVCTPEVKSENSDHESRSADGAEGCKLEIIETEQLEPYQMLDSRLTTVTALPGSADESLDSSRGPGTLYLWQVFPT